MPTPTTTHITDHDDRAIAHLPGYQQSATNWNKLLRAFLSEVQALENALDQLENEKYLSVAVGQQLDDIGTILDLTREGRSDSLYRYALQGQASTLAGSGEGNLLLDGYLFLVQADKTTITEHRPALAELVAYVESDDLTAEDDAAILAAMGKTKAQGVGLVLLTVNESIANGLAFLWGDSADADANGDIAVDADRGLGDEADADGNGNITPGLGQGGNFARVLT